MNDDLMQKQQQAIAQAMEMYERAQKKQGKTPKKPIMPQAQRPSNTNTDNAPSEIEVQISGDPFGQTPLDTKEDIIEIPPAQQSDLSELETFAEGGDNPAPNFDLDNSPETEPAKGDVLEPFDWELEEGETENNPAPFLDIDELRETEYPKRDILEPFDWELEEADDDFVLLQEEPEQNVTEQPPVTRGNKSNRQAPRAKQNTPPNGNNGKKLEKGFETKRGRSARTKNAHWQNTQGYTEQYYEDTDSAGEEPSVTANSNWQNTDGYTEQYYEDEDTYEEFSTGHSQEATQASTKNRDSASEEQQDTVYSNRPNHTNNTAQNTYTPQNFDDSAILLLLLFTLLEENRDPELIIILLYLLG